MVAIIFFTCLVIISIVLVRYVKPLLLLIRRARLSPPRMQNPPPSLFISDPEAGYQNKPNLDLTITLSPTQKFSLCTNNHGARIANISSYSSQQKHISILALGDSYTLGYGMNYHDTYLGYLEQKLRLPVLNLGVNGYGSLSILTQLKRHINCNPDYVLLGHVYDHPDRTFSGCYPGFMLKGLTIPHLAFDAANHIIQINCQDNKDAIKLTENYYKYVSGAHKSFSFLRDIYWTWRYNTATKRQSSERYFGRRTPTTEQHAQIGIACLAAMLDVIKQQSMAKFIILYIPNFNQPLIDPPPAYLQDFCGINNIILIDISTELQKMKSIGESLIIPNDGHLNAAVHVMIGTKLCAILAKNTTAYSAATPEVFNTSNKLEHATVF